MSQKINLINYRLIGDKYADEFIHHKFNSIEGKVQLRNDLSKINTNTDLTIFAKKYTEYDWIKNFTEYPAWADKKKLKTGSDFFNRYAETIMNLLGLLSLPYCYAAADGARVLSLSERIKYDAENRLTETASFVWDLMAPDAFSENGKAFASILKVRLIHASIRYYLSNSKEWNPDWGTPVNQEDMAGTNLSFSLIVIRGLRKLGIAVSHADQESFLHLWNFVGHFLGLTDQLLPENGLAANNLEQQIRKSQFKKSDHGSALAHQLVDFMSLNTEQKISRDYLLQIMRFMLTDEVADLLDIKPNSDMQINISSFKLLTGLQLFLNSSKSHHQKKNEFEKQINRGKIDFSLPLHLAFSKD
ncbi:MAG: oxygenase MpaB family protein [Daejeonella sp.]